MSNNKLEKVRKAGAKRYVINAKKKKEKEPKISIPWGISLCSTRTTVLYRVLFSCLVVPRL
jgi:hypothetical protein